MFVKIVFYFSLFRICNSLEKYSTKGTQCRSLKGLSYIRTHDQIQCGGKKSVNVERIWIDRQPSCVYNKSQTIRLSNEQIDIYCSTSSYCGVIYDNFHRESRNKYLHIRFQCTGCIALLAHDSKMITCPSDSLIRIVDVSYHGYKNCPANLQRQQDNTYFKDICKRWYSCSVTNKDPLYRIASIYFQCRENKIIKDDYVTTDSYGKYDISGDDTSTEYHDEDITTESYGDKNYPDIYISTKSYGRSSNSNEDIYTESPDDSSKPDEDIYTESPVAPNFAAIAGGILGGVLLIICIIVGVFLSRRRSCTTSGNEQIITNCNPTYDPNDVQTEGETNQQGHLMNSPDTLYVSTSHAVNVDNPTNEESNTYSHIRNTVDDSDVMYDHTIRHNSHHTCDGDYGITHRRITEDDYDVSGNYRQSLSKVADPVYN